MRIEYVIVGFVILTIVLLVALSMIGGANSGLGFIAKYFTK